MVISFEREMLEIRIRGERILATYRGDVPGTGHLSKPGRNISALRKPETMQGDYVTRSGQSPYPPGRLETMFAIAAEGACSCLQAREPWCHSSDRRLFQTDIETKRHERRRPDYGTQRLSRSSCTGGRQSVSFSLRGKPGTSRMIASLTGFLPPQLLPWSPAPTGVCNGSRAGRRISNSITRRIEVHSTG